MPDCLLEIRNLVVRILPHLVLEHASKQGRMKVMHGRIGTRQLRMVGTDCVGNLPQRLGQILQRQLLGSYINLFAQTEGLGPDRIQYLVERQKNGPDRKSTRLNSS